MAACMLPVPCTSFTTARNRTSVIRSTQEPWGISRQMNEREARSIALGNATAEAALKIIRLLNKYKVPWIVENPRTSYLWHLPELHAVSEAAHGHFRVADFCQFGARWRKKTGFLCGNHKTSASHLAGCISLLGACGALSGLPFSNVTKFYCTSAYFINSLTP